MILLNSCRGRLHFHVGWFKIHQYIQNQLRTWSWRQVCSTTYPFHYELASIENGNFLGQYSLFYRENWLVF